MTKIYAKAGVTAVWTSDAQITVVMIPRARAEQMHQIPDAMGFAPGSETRPGHIAYVIAFVLAAAMAHEIGHLLLPGVAHSVDGIMRAKLGSLEFRLASQAARLFLPNQARMMQARLQSY